MAMMTNYGKNVNGVSIVVGVILLVAVTAVLAAALAGYAMQTSSIPAAKLVCVGVERVVSGSGPGTGIISVEDLGGLNAEYLRQGSPGTECFKVFANGVQAGTVAPPLPAATMVYAGPEVGSKQYFQVDPQASVIVVACYTDNTEYQVWSGAVS